MPLAARLGDVHEICQHLVASGGLHRGVIQTFRAMATAGGRRFCQADPLLIG